MSRRYKNLCAERALIFRITHRDNIPWILDHGLHCQNSATQDPNFVTIGNPDLIDKRTGHEVKHPPGGYLSDYVPFYFTPFSPMLYQIITGHNGIRQRRKEEIVVLASSLHRLKELGVPFLFTDCHAFLKAARFSEELADLSRIDWEILQSRDFQHDPDDPAKVQRYMAEALVHVRLPVSGLDGFVCYNEEEAAKLRASLESRALDMKVAVLPTWYF